MEIKYKVFEKIWQHIGIRYEQNKSVYTDSDLYSKTNKIKKANKSERWMPRLWEAMKDVISCDKLRVGANNH